MYKKILTLILITLSAYSCSKNVSSTDSNFLLLALLSKDNSDSKNPLDEKIRKILSNEKVMKDYGITILYGNDTKCTEDLGVWGETTGEKKCIVEGKMTKIDYVQKVIKIYIDKMKAKDIDIVPVLKRNSPYLLMFNKSEDKEQLFDGGEREQKGGVIMEKSQDLQANETFVIKDKDKGFSSTADARNAAPEEIIHLLQNYGISETIPKWQEKLDQETDDALKRNLLNWEDKDGDEIGDDEDDENGGLPKSDLDDEFLNDGIEAYFNMRGGSGYIKSESICISPECDAKNSNQMLKENLPVLYQLVKELFGSDTSFYP